ncbi:hypothetical protein GCM10010415_20750 [Streptomyces atrovirens]|uniref:Uncharacterized protein n=1 Tax=Streptomyces atrovirens TaxID=285556 RepID=A0ABW0E090_9ACTN
MTNVFTHRVAELNRRGKTYQQMAADCDFKRSVTWWNKMYWTEIDNPPEPALFPYLAKALEVTERRVRELVAEQWCDVRPDDTVPEHLRTLLSVAREVDERDALKLVELAMVMYRKRVITMERDRYSAMLLEAYTAGSGGPLTAEQLGSLRLPEKRAVKNNPSLEVTPEAQAMLDAIPEPKEE